MDALANQAAGVPVARRSPEWGWLEYLLQLVATTELPPEYDSFFVRHETAGDADDAKLGMYPSQVLHHEYVVREPAQAMPLYLVHFEFNPEDEETLRLPLCDNCGSQAAKVFCEADDACFCPSCDVRVHAVNTIARNHVRVEVNRRPGGPLGRCHEHPDTEADEYCMDCRVPICPHCRSLGGHSSGEPAKHMRRPLREAYEHVLRKDPLAASAAQTRQQAEQQLVVELDAKLAAVQAMGRSVEDDIYDRVQRAVRQGQELAEHQMSTILAGELEAKRQLEEVVWAESFLEDHIKALPPPDFLKAWLLHSRLRDDLATSGLSSRMDSGATSKAGPVLRVDGRLRLHAGEATQSPARSSSRGRGRDAPNRSRGGLPSLLALSG